jgi:hypothetical protein
MFKSKTQKKHRTPPKKNPQTNSSKNFLNKAGYPSSLLKCNKLKNYWGFPLCLKIPGFHNSDVGICLEVQNPLGRVRTQKSPGPGSVPKVFSLPMPE